MSHGRTWKRREGGGGPRACGVCIPQAPGGKGLREPWWDVLPCSALLPPGRCWHSLGTMSGLAPSNCAEHGPEAGPGDLHQVGVWTSFHSLTKQSPGPGDTSAPAALCGGRTDKCALAPALVRWHMFIRVTRVSEKGHAFSFITLSTLPSENL